jgi:hypothetical protein
MKHMNVSYAETLGNVLNWMCMDAEKHLHLLGPEHRHAYLGECERAQTMPTRVIEQR